MKTIALLLLLLPIFCFAQKDSTIKHKLYVSSTLTIDSILNADKSITLNIRDSVMVKKGTGEDVSVFFTLIVPKHVWEEYKNYNNESKSDAITFMMLADIITFKAKNLLTNEVSFVPMKKQLISYYKKSHQFSCIYKCYGRNGYGNLIESEVFVQYKFSKK